MRILVLCTGNSARSQMAEALLRSFDARIEVVSAGTAPAPRVHPSAVRAMAEIGIDLSGQRPKPVDEFLAQPFDFVITVCSHANETCPVFSGAVRHRVHIGFDDPAAKRGTEAEVLEEFRRVRDGLAARLREFFDREIATSEGRR